MANIGPANYIEAESDWILFLVSSLIEDMLETIRIRAK